MKKSAKYILLVISISIMVITMSSCGKKKEINIGVMLPLTGDIAVYGQSSKNGMEIAIDENKDFLEKNGIKILFDDEKGEPKTAINIIQKYISIHSCPVVIGGVSSSVALAIAPTAENNKVILMAPFASSPLLTKAGDYVFRVMPSDAFQASLMPAWLNEFGYNRIGIVYVKNQWGESLKDAFIYDFEKLGGKIFFTEGINESQKEFRSLIVKIAGQLRNVDAIYLPTYPQEAGSFLKQFREQKLNYPIFGGDTWANELLVKVGGDAVNGVRFLAPLQYNGKEFISFEKQYMKKFEKAPDLPASAGYDAMNVIIYSIKQLRSSNKEITGDNIKAVLYSIKNFMGATGNTSFDNNGDVVTKQFSRRTILNGRITYTEK